MKFDSSLTTKTCWKYICCKGCTKKQRKSKKAFNRKSGKSNKKSQFASGAASIFTTRIAKLARKRKNQKVFEKIANDIIPQLQKISGVYAYKVQSYLDKFDYQNFQNWRLARLKHYCIYSLLSMQEGTADNNIIKVIMKTIPISIICSLIENNFTQYRNMYGVKFNMNSLGKFVYEGHKIEIKQPGEEKGVLYPKAGFLRDRYEHLREEHEGLYEQNKKNARSGKKSRLNLFHKNSYKSL